MSELGEGVALISRIADSWREPRGLIAALLLALVVSLALPLSLLFKLGLAGFAAILILLGWFWSRRLPMPSANRVGIAVAIQRPESVAERQFAGDFVSELRELLLRGHIGRSFQFIEVPAHAQKNLTLTDGDAVNAFRSRVRCHFLVAGRVRFRKINGVNHLVLDLVGAVAHSPIPAQLQEQFAREFGELLPRRIALPSDQDLLAFTFTSEWANLVAKYIIGIAAALSGDLDYAEQLYRAVREELVTKTVDSPVVDKIARRLPQRFAELYEAKANAEFNRWKETKDIQFARSMKGYLEEIDPSLLTARRFVHLRAITAFLVDEDVDEALGILESAKRDPDSTWYWNEGFLYAFRGNLKKASQLYRKGTLMGLPPDVPAELEEFMVWVLTIKPEKVQIHYCLGVLNRDVKGDTIRAREEFEAFIKETSADQFSNEREIVAGWLRELS